MIEAWKGKFGNDYTERNTNSKGREIMFLRILESLHEIPKSILEVGSNRGLNLDVLSGLTDARLIGLEPNEYARSQIKHEAIEGTAQFIPVFDNSVDMVFTCGVLIHINPDDLKQACDEIYRVSSKYIVCIEYFSDKPEEIEYRGQRGLLWKRDFGSFWMDNYKLKLVDYGFFWKRTTGLDNLTYWIFMK